MAQDSNVNLKWDAHQATLNSVFDSLLDTESLADCTVGAEGQHLKAHKVILSACSQYFELLFRHYHGKHIVIVLPGAEFHILKALIQFMYRGEILIQQDELDALLRLADFLQVKGLSCGGNDISEKKQTHKRRHKSPSYSEHTPSHCHVSPERDEPNDSAELLEVSGGSPQAERLQKQDYRKLSPLSGRARQRKESDWYTSREEPSFQQDLVPPSDEFSHNIFLQRPEHPNKRNSFCGIFSDVESSSSVTSQVPVCSLRNFSRDTVSGEDLTTAKPLTLVVKTEYEENTVTETFTEAKDEYHNDFNQDCVDNVSLDCDDSQCQNLRDNSISISELTQSSFSDVESFAHQIELQEAECTNTKPGHQTCPTTKQYKCTSCGRSYKHYYTLLRHQKYECGKDLKKFQCPHCPLRCKQKDNLKRHIATHFSPNTLR